MSTIILTYDEWKARYIVVPLDVIEELKEYHGGVDEVEAMCHQLYTDYLESMDQDHM